VKEPGHFEVRTSSQVTRIHFFVKKVDLFVLVVTDLFYGIIGLLELNN